MSYTLTNVAGCEAPPISAWPYFTCSQWCTARAQYSVHCQSSGSTDVMVGLQAHLQPADVIDLYQPQALAAGLKAQVQAMLWEVDDYVLVELCLPGGARSTH